MLCHLYIHIKPSFIKAVIELFLPNVPVNNVPTEAPAVVELKKKDLSRDARFRLDKLATAGKNVPFIFHKCMKIKNIIQ